MKLHLYLHLLVFAALESYYPPLSCTDLLPSYHECRAAKNLNCEYRTILRQQQALRQWDHELRGLHDEALRRYLLWDDASDAINPVVKPSYRRIAFKRLSDRMGWQCEVDMIERRLPLPIPGMGD